LTPAPVGAQHATTDGGTQNANHGPEAPDSDGDAEDGGEAEVPDTEAPDSAANAERPQNHGWFVSEAAKGPTPAAFESHGDYVSSIAQGTQGKPDAAANGAEKSAAGKAKGAAARATHAGN
jgi:hypothetical protein